MSTDPTAESQVTLVVVTAENLDTILGLSVSNEQQQYVASNARSIAQAHFHQEAWFRAIFADDTPVGFLMLHDENLLDQVRRPDYYFLWRLMIDQRYQGMGFGRGALQCLVEHLRGRPNAKVLLSSYEEGPHEAGGFYAKLGFVKTGNKVGEEIEIQLSIDLAHG